MNLKTKIYNISKIYTWNNHKNKLDIEHNKDILIENDKIIDISNEISNYDNAINGKNCIVTPGFIDSHTHPIFINHRSKEFLMRLEGKSYEEISNSGGGIISSVNNVRSSSEKELYNSAFKNIKPFLSFGTTTVEAKSGYGLTLFDEIKSLKVIKKLNNNLEIDIIPTFLGAHAIPPEFKHNKNKYIELICEEMIPEISEKKLAIFCDVFCEPGYFSIKESKKILIQAKKYKLKPRLHVDEFHDSGGAELAVEIGAISADHLMAVSEQGINYLSKSNTVANILPGTTYFLNSNQYANGRKMIDKGCMVSIASDFNPGTCTIRSLPNIMYLAMQNCGLTLEEAFLAITYNAAKAIDSDSNIGLVKKGYNADLIFWNLEHLSEIPYWFDSSFTKIDKIFKKGKVVNLL